METFIYASATKLAQAIQRKEVSSEEVVGAFLDRIETVNPQLNAVVQLTADAALAQAREADAALARGEVHGPLHGLPMTIKDAFETAGVVSTGGSTGRAGFVPRRDATAVARLRAAGGIMLGKTNVPEMSLAFESDNLIYGRTLNPYDFTRTPGGSSGGEAAIISAGGSPFGLGSDAAGSIRVPSHNCGLAGLKPTAGRVPRTGHFPPVDGILESIWHVGPLARRVEDLALVLPIIAGPDWKDPAIVPMPLGDPQQVECANLRVAFHTDNGVIAPTAETVQTVKAAATALSDMGLRVDEALPACIEQAQEILFGLRSADGGEWLRALIRSAGGKEIHPLLQRFLGPLEDKSMTTAELGQLMVRAHAYRSEMLAFLDSYDVMVCPVNAFPAMLHGTSRDDDRALSYSYTLAFNLTGWPAAVVRCGWSPEGLPIGVQVVARPWREDVALAVAQRLEAALGGWQAPPI